jgi:hypothetical protein
MVFALSKPAALFGGVGESGEYALRGSGIAAFNDERAVDYGLSFHFLSSFGGMVKLWLKYYWSRDNCQART